MEINQNILLYWKILDNYWIIYVIAQVENKIEVDNSSIRKCINNKNDYITEKIYGI